MDTFMIRDSEKPGIRFRWVYDPDYRTRGSYSYDTEEETKAAEDWELERLDDGRLVALGCIVQKKCGECGEWRDGDSLWGIVIEPEAEKLDVFASENMDIES